MPHTSSSVLLGTVASFVDLFLLSGVVAWVDVCASLAGLSSMNNVFRLCAAAAGSVGSWSAKAEKLGVFPSSIKEYTCS